MRGRVDEAWLRQTREAQLGFVEAQLRLIRKGLEPGAITYALFILLAKTCQSRSDNWGGREKFLECCGAAWDGKTEGAPETGDCDA
jgi:hypothetical protein